MSERAEVRGRRIPEFATRSVWVAACFSGVACAVLGAALACVVSLVCWLPDAGASGSPGSTLRAGLLAFLGAHHGGLRVDGTPTAFLPLGMLALVLVLAYRAGTTLAEIADDLGERRPDRLARALGLQTVSYVVACLLLSAVSSIGSSSVSTAGLTVAAVLEFGIAAGISLSRRSPLGPDVLARVPVAARDAARPVLAASGVLLLGGALLVAGSLVLHASTVMTLSRTVGGGFSGLPVLLLGVLAVPNAVLAGTTYLAGPGFSVGTGTHVAPLASTHGTVPSFPILGALPTGAGASAPVLALLAAVLLAAGIALVWGSRTLPARAALQRSAVAAGLLGLLWAVLAWQSGGEIGAGRLHTVGPSAWQTGLAVAVETFAVSAVVLGATAAVRWWRSRDTAAEDEPLRPKAGAGSR